MRSYREAFKRWSASPALPMTPGIDNTVMVVHGDVFAIRYYDTEIVTFHPDGRVVFRHGGWRTSSTIRRFNLYAPKGFKFKGRFLTRDGVKLGKWIEGVTIKAGRVTVGLLTDPDPVASFMRAFR